MHVLKSFMIFLIGAGFAAGAYISGAAERLPDYIGQLRHVRIAKGGTLSLEPGASRPDRPVVLRVSSYGRGAGPLRCEPAYRVANEMSEPVHFTWEAAGDPDASVMNASRDIVKIPPGSTMVPTGGHSQAPAGGPRRCQEQVEEIELDER